ncbi:PREDICTED: uncharacterized protein LOC109584324 [Amphimedon queenslandica]|uniref:Glycosyltransferase family 92 protein n=1 Tax=Amphimedon queenslandica TaxID=400682 RepID=A0A1X7U7W3_AMPQE|nr:PREDICTED: uncharacterized protein LOC109584324 [Amphimedon queenslandica]XP_019855581.1 PREDICTED: uncharacterized protein LOC109584324 [Amphimedon queenslandica]|eukprot:XP_019855580.1 PREDICTED: uncharacterized protein LOC109584324 [Amphimedon queenslandica]
MLKTVFRLELYTKRSVLIKCSIAVVLSVVLLLSVWQGHVRGMFGNGPMTVNETMIEEDIILPASFKKLNPANNISLQHPNTRNGLWIKISQSFIVRRIGYLDKRDLNNITITLLSMQDKRKHLPQEIFLKIYDQDNRVVACLSTSFELGALKGRDTYVLYLIRSSRLMDYQTKSISYVKISTNKQCVSDFDTILIRTVGDKPPKYDFGMCLHKAIENISPKVIHDWVKLNIALGAEVIMLYLQTKAPQEIFNVLLPFINKGVVEVLDWQLEPPLTNVSSSSYGQTGVISECIWYNMHRVKYLGLNDADEFFVPLKHNNVQDMLRYLENIQEARRAGSYIFTNALIKGHKVLPIVKKTLNSKKCDSLSVDTLPSYFKRSEYCLEKGGQSVKMIVKPDAVFTAWGHVLITYRSDKYTKEYIIPDTLGLSYHYRSHWNNYHGCRTLRKETRIIEKFFTNITQCNVV